MKRKIKTFIGITIGVLLISIAYYFFLEPVNLVTGGVTGLMILFKPILPFEPSVLMYILNISLLIIGLFTLGKDFFLKTCYASVLSPTIILIFEKTLTIGSTGFVIKILLSSSLKRLFLKTIVL